MTDIKIPNVGESVSEVTIAQWFKQPGDAVKKDEAIVELETDKAAQELVSPEDGVLEEILVAEGENATIGTVIAKLGSGSGKAKAEEKPAETPKEDTKTEAKKETPAPALNRKLSHLAHRSILMCPMLASPSPKSRWPLGWSLLEIR